MRRYWVLPLAVLTLLGTFAAPALAQAPQPKVTITGIVDNVGTYSERLSMNNALRGGLAAGITDHEFYGRTRGRFDIIGEVGKAKTVLGLEIDGIYGGTGATSAAGTPINNLGKVVSAGHRPDGSGAAFYSNTDNTAAIEIKWLYVELPATGPNSLLPFVPWTGSLTLGAQPYALGLKPSILADSDFAGGTYRVTLTPNVKGSLTFAQLEQNSTGFKDNFFRGNDLGAILKLDVTPFKGLTVSPIFAAQEIQGSTSNHIRRATGGYSTIGPNFSPDSNAGGFQAGIFTPVVVGCTGNPPANGGTAGDGGSGAIAGPVGFPGGMAFGHENCRRTTENRYFAGLDARWDMGPFYLAPTFIYQFGQRERFESVTDPGAHPRFGTVNAAGGCTTAGPGDGHSIPAGSFDCGIGLKKRTADISAWIFDTTAGYRWGPLLLEARGVYTPGNRARDNLNRTINYYQPFQCDNSYLSGWTEIVGNASIDYLSSLYGFSSSRSGACQIGYDRYGKKLFALMATYALTPAFSIYGRVAPQWTDEEVDSRQQITAAGLQMAPTFQYGPSGAVVAPGVGGTPTRPCDRTCRGRDDYLGTELNAGFTWRFAPGLTYDLVVGYMVTGSAYANAQDTGVHSSRNPATTVPSTLFKTYDPGDPFLSAMRVRYAF